MPSLMKAMAAGKCRSRLWFELSSTFITLYVRSYKMKWTLRMKGVDGSEPFGDLILGFVVNRVITYVRKEWLDATGNLEYVRHALWYEEKHEVRFESASNEEKGALLTAALSILRSEAALMFPR